jgi:capsular polysaccharide transport system permease protein
VTAMQQDDFRSHLLGMLGAFGAASRRDRARCYRFARDILRTGMAEISQPLDRRARTKSYFQLEAAIRDIERDLAAAESGAETASDLEPAEGSSMLPIRHLGAAKIEQGGARAWRPGGFSDFFHVVGALIIRSLRITPAKDPMGFAWLFLSPILTIAVHFWIFMFLGLGTIMNMPALPFLILGIGGWHMMRVMTIKLGYEVYRDRNLANLQRVDSFAILLAKATEMAGVYSIVTIAGMIAVTAINGYEAPRNLLGVAYYWILLAVAGMGLGMFLNFLREFVPGIGLMVMPVFRVGFFFSGVVLVSEQFPDEIRQYLAWNPILNIMQLLRTEYFAGYISQDATPAYASFFALGSLFLGLAGEVSRQRKVATA